jgi:hypothetical protein
VPFCFHNTNLCTSYIFVVQCLYEAGRHDKVQILDIFCEAINPDLQNASNRDLFSKTNSESLSGANLGSGRGFIDQAINTVRYDSRSRVSRSDVQCLYFIIILGDRGMYVKLVKG